MTFIAPGSYAAANGTWLGPSANSTAYGFCFPQPRTADTTNQAATYPMVANQCLWYRSLGSGLISSLVVWCTAANGSIQVGIFDTTPVASNVLYPRNLIAVSAQTVAAAAYMTLPLNTPVMVTPSNFIAIAASGTPTFSATNSTGTLGTGVDPTWGSGGGYTANGAFPIPTVAPSSMPAIRGTAIIIHGLT